MFTDPENQVRGAISDGEVRADFSEAYQTERLTISGMINNLQVYQRLSKSQRNGHFCLSTVFTEPGGSTQTIRITEGSPTPTIKVLEASLFMDVIQRNLEQGI